MRVIASLCFSLLMLIGLSADQPKRGIDSTKIDQYNSLSQFDYDRVIQPSESALEKVLGEIADFISWIFGSFVGYIILAVLIALLVWVILKQLSKGRIVLERGDADYSDPLRSLTEEQLNQLDLDAMIRKALEMQDFRAAIRFTFVKILRSLQQRQLIQWHPEKTNGDYLLELTGEHRGHLQRATLMYEYVWYGEFAANNELFETVRRVEAELERLHNHQA